MTDRPRILSFKEWLKLNQKPFKSVKTTKEPENGLRTDQRQ